MNRMYLLVTLLLATAPLPAADVGVSISIGQPGFYGRIDMGDYPQPRVIYQQPRFMYRAAANRPPIYMRVPPGHAKNWRKHCRTYNACNERVYFVQDDWYEREYVPRYQERHGNRRDGRQEDRGDDRRDDRRYDRNDDRRDDGRDYRGDDHRDYRGDNGRDDRGDDRRDDRGDDRRDDRGRDERGDNRGQGPKR